MAKIVVGKLASTTRKEAKKKRTSVVEKRVRDQSGNVSLLRTVDALSPTLTEDITYVFTRNVDKARRENQRLFGSRDGVSKP